MSLTAVILGATGTVGRGITRVLRSRGWDIVAIGRNPVTLADIQREAPGTTVIRGSVGDDESAIAIAARVNAVAPVINAVITTINLPQAPARLLDTSAEQLAKIFAGNVISQLCVAKAFLPLLTGGGRYICIGGGMADVTVNGMGGVSMCQAAQRNLLRFLAQETEGEQFSVVELMLYSHIVDPADDLVADPRDIRADEVGAHIVAILECPQLFAGPILTLKSRKQVGLPQRD